MDIPHSPEPHGDTPVLVSGNTTNPTKALILVHGRGASAKDIMSITTHLELPQDVLVLAPEAAHNSWYPQRFIMSQEANQPDLNSAILRILTLVATIKNQYQVPSERIALAGFSQGACLVAEYLKRNPKRYLAAAIFSGGLIGDDAEVKHIYEGSLARTPIYIGCDVEDFHIPQERVSVTADYMNDRNADVTLRFYTNVGHTIHQEGITFLQEHLAIV